MQQQPITFFTENIGNKIKNTMPHGEGTCFTKIVNAAHAQQLFALQDKGFIFSPLEIPASNEIPATDNAANTWSSSPYYFTKLS